MFRRLLRRLSAPLSSSSSGNGTRPNHLGCPRCRRVLIVPSREVFRCPCGMVFRVTSMSNVQLFLMSNQPDNLNAKGTGLPRELIELMPVVTFAADKDDDKEKKSCEVVQAPVVGGEVDVGGKVEAEEVCTHTEDVAVADVGKVEPACVETTLADNSDKTCRICLCDYKAGDLLRVLPCFHRFHVEDIDEWLDRNPRCPLCHLDVNEALTGAPSFATLNPQENNPLARFSNA